MPAQLGIDLRMRRRITHEPAHDQGAGDDTGDIPIKARFQVHRLEPQPDVFGRAVEHGHRERLRMPDLTLPQRLVLLAGTLAVWLDCYLEQGAALLKRASLRRSLSRTTSGVCRTEGRCSPSSSSHWSIFC